MLDKQIKQLVDQELATKGLQRVEDDSANLYMGYQVGAGQEKYVSSYSSGWGCGRGWYGVDGVRPVELCRTMRPKEVGPIVNVRYGSDLTDP